VEKIDVFFYKISAWYLVLFFILIIEIAIRNFIINRYFSCIFYKFIKFDEICCIINAIKNFIHFISFLENKFISYKRLIFAPFATSFFHILLYIGQIKLNLPKFGIFLICLTIFILKIQIILNKFYNSISAIFDPQFNFLLTFILQHFLNFLIWISRSIPLELYHIISSLIS